MDLNYSKQTCMRMIYVEQRGTWRWDPEAYSGITSACPWHFLKLAGIPYFSADFAQVLDLISGRVDLLEAGRLVSIFADTKFSP